MQNQRCLSLRKPAQEFCPSLLPQLTLVPHDVSSLNAGCLHIFHSPEVKPSSPSQRPMNRASVLECARPLALFPAVHHSKSAIIGHSLTTAHNDRMRVPPTTSAICIRLNSAEIQRLAIRTFLNLRPALLRLPVRSYCHNLQVVVKDDQKAIAVISALPGAGHLSAAVLYVTMGLLAGLVALGIRGETPDARVAVRALWEQPFGPAMLILVAVGSLCLVCWRLLQAFWDVEGKGRSFIGLCKRARYLISAAFYLTVPIGVARILFHMSTPSGEQLAEQAASAVIHFPFGWSIVLGTGMGFICTGVYYLYRMCRGNFEGIFHCERMTEGQRKICFTLGRLGCAARGIIFLVMGYYLMLAGWNVDPRQVEGQAGALHIIAHQPLGPMMLGFIAIGLVALGIFSLAEVRYGKIPKDRLVRLYVQTMERARQAKGV
jgi:hypothetical protein